MSLVLVGSVLLMASMGRGTGLGDLGLPSSTLLPGLTLIPDIPSSDRLGTASTGSAIYDMSHHLFIIKQDAKSSSKFFELVKSLTTSSPLTSYEYFIVSDDLTTQVFRTRLDCYVVSGLASSDSLSIYLSWDTQTFFTDTWPLSNPKLVAKDSSSQYIWLPLTFDADENCTQCSGYRSCNSSQCQWTLCQKWCSATSPCNSYSSSDQKDPNFVFDLCAFTGPQDDKCKDYFTFNTCSFDDTFTTAASLSELAFCQSIEGSLSMRGITDASSSFFETYLSRIREIRGKASFTSLKQIDLQSSFPVLDFSQLTYVEITGTSGSGLYDFIENSMSLGTQVTFKGNTDTAESYNSLDMCDVMASQSTILASPDPSLNQDCAPLYYSEASKMCTTEYSAYRSNGRWCSERYVISSEKDLNPILAQGCINLCSVELTGLGENANMATIHRAFRAAQSIQILRVHDNPSLQSLAFFESLTKVSKLIEISNNPYLTAPFPQFPQLYSSFKDGATSYIVSLSKNPYLCTASQCAPTRHVYVLSIGLNGLTGTPNLDDFKTLFSIFSNEGVVVNTSSWQAQNSFSTTTTKPTVMRRSFSVSGVATFMLLFPSTSSVSEYQFLSSLETDLLAELKSINSSLYGNANITAIEAATDLQMLLDILYASSALIVQVKSQTSTAITFQWPASLTVMVEYRPFPEPSILARLGSIIGEFVPLDTLSPGTNATYGSAAFESVLQWKKINTVPNPLTVSQLVADGFYQFRFTDLDDSTRTFAQILRMANPSLMVYNLSYVISSKSVTLSWSRNTSFLNESSFNQAIYNFELLFFRYPNSSYDGDMHSDANGASELYESVMILSNASSFTFSCSMTKCLKPYQWWKIKFRAVAKSNFHGPYIGADAMTLEDVPGVPVSLSISPLNNSAIVNVLAPLAPNGRIIHYLLRVSPTDSPAMASSYTFSSPPFTISDMRNQGYSFNVSACTAVGCGASLAAVYVHNTTVLASTNPTSSSSSSTTLPIGIGAGAAILFILMIVIFILYVRRSRRVQSAYVPPKPDEWEYPMKKVVLKEELGSGQFGTVHKGEVENIAGMEGRLVVAVKRCTKDGSDDRVAFLAEADLMKKFSTPEKSHPNVVRLLGVCTQTLPLYVIVEYMAKGDLKKYLQSARPENAKIVLKVYHLTKMALDISSGMTFLAFNDFVHRDLACRNCLVAADGTVKIADFGLSRDVHYSNYYRKTTAGVLPVRWMAPEALSNGVYTSESDVWSFGVVMWEIYSLANMPYPALGNQEVYEKVATGYVMSKPSQCPPDVYALMKSCWALDPRGRPTFKSLEFDLTKLLKAQRSNPDCDDAYGFDDDRYIHMPENNIPSVRNSGYIALDSNPSPEKRESVKYLDTLEEANVDSLQRGTTLRSPYVPMGTPRNPPPLYVQPPEHGDEPEGYQPFVPFASRPPQLYEQHAPGRPQVTMYQPVPANGGPHVGSDYVSSNAHVAVNALYSPVPFSQGMHDGDDAPIELNSLRDLASK